MVIQKLDPSTRLVREVGYFLWLKDKTDTINTEKLTANISVSATVMASPPL
ncbi:MAG TPA: hypothetical protein VNS08_08580 [Ureibacillus sp.]|nr:hypothetical protein [Ureibacillus sp.]